MIKMISKVNFLKNKIKLFMSNGYRIKVGKNIYILFKKEEDYVNLIHIERVFLIHSKIYYLSMLKIKISDNFFVCH